MRRFTREERENCLRLLNQGWNQQQIADIYNVHQSRISRLKTRLQTTDNHNYTSTAEEIKKLIFDQKELYYGLPVKIGKGVVYRDLKPENLLIDKNGYIKLTDFGFAKKMPARGKTFTFAGTPEYVAPEIVLNRGHDKAVDYWAFGVFIFELLTGRTPFRTGDSSHMRTYNKILNGIDNVNFPTYMNPKARNLIEKLCRPVPAERLGMQRVGTKDIKAHKWYQGFDFIRFQQCQIPSAFKPKLKDVTDTSNFDLFKQDKDYPPDETSGWDSHF